MQPSFPLHGSLILQNSMLIIPGQSMKQRESCDILTEHRKIERQAGREVYPSAPKQEMSDVGKGDDEYKDNLLSVSC
jgi:hypothetical protein